MTKPTRTQQDPNVRPARAVNYMFALDLDSATILHRMIDEREVPYRCPAALIRHAVRLHLEKLQREIEA